MRAAAALGCTLAVLASPSARAAFAGRPGRIAFEAVQGTFARLETVDPATGAVQLLPVPPDATAPAWSPGGTRLAFASGGSIVVSRADGTHRRTLTRASGQDVSDSAPAWSPDGRLLAFESTRNRFGGAGDVWLIRPDGKRLRPFLTGPAAEVEPAFSPDGRRIAFASDRDGDADVYVVRTNGADLTELTRNRATDGEPAWSPDGRRIAFVSDRSGHPQLYVMGADGRHARRLTRSPLVDQSPAWSPDGREIAFARGPDLARDPQAPGTFDIWVVPAAGGAARPLVQTPADDLAPAWQALPR